MIRLLTLLAAIVMLAGCVVHETYREPYYGDSRSSGGYYSAPGGDYYENDGYTGDDYSYQSGYPSGDYYYGYDSGYGASSSWYVDYPFYYSLFWPLNYSYRDPYWYPGYHYGVTWFPRNYFSIGVSYSSHWPHHHYTYLAYSPYRYSWVDNYYDTRPWHSRSRPRYDYDRYYPLPRYGSAHNEAERLSAVRRVQRPVASSGPSGPRPGTASYNTTGRPSTGASGRTPANSGVRGADYRSDVRRQDPGVRIFDDTRRTDPRVNSSNTRGNARPSVSSSPGSRQPASAATREAVRTVPAQRQPQRDPSTSIRTGRQDPKPGSRSGELPLRRNDGSSVPSRNVERVAPVRSSTAPAAVRPATRSVESLPVERSNALPRQAAPATRPVYTSSPMPERQRTQPAYRAPAASASSPSPAAQSYSAPQSQPAPTRYQAPSRPQSYSAPESPSSSRSSDSSSQGSERRSSSDGVRRVGSERNR